MKGTSVAHRLTGCPLCGSGRLRARPVPQVWTSDVAFREHRGSYGVSRCRGCSFEFVNPRPNDALLARLYDDASYTYHDPDAALTRGSRAARVLDFVGRYARGRRMLDYGCGAGALLRAAADAGWSATGYDPSGAAVEVCRRQGLVATANLGELPAFGFDAVLLNHVFEHVTDHRQTLEALHRLLGPRGRVFIECPNVRSLRALLSHPWLSRYAGFDERYRAFPIHLSYFSPRTLREVMDKHGFDVERIETWGFGIEELLREPEADPREAAVERELAPKRAREAGLITWALRAGKPFAKAVLRRLILDAGLGENIVVVARASRRWKGPAA